MSLVNLLTNYRSDIICPKNSRIKLKNIVSYNKKECDNKDIEEKEKMR